MTEIKSLQQQLEKKQKEVLDIQEKINKELSKTELIDVPELGIEVEKEVSYKRKSYNQIMAFPEVQEKIKNGWRLLCTIRPGDYVNEVAFLENNLTYSKILKMDGSSSKDDFFVQQMYKRNQDKGYVAGFGSGSYYSSLNCRDDSDYSNSYLGVRFCRKKNFESK